MWDSLNSLFRFRELFQNTTHVFTVCALGCMLNVYTEKGRAYAGAINEIR